MFNANEGLIVLQISPFTPYIYICKNVVSPCMHIVTLSNVSDSTCAQSNLHFVFLHWCSFAGKWNTKAYLKVNIFQMSHFLGNSNLKVYIHYGECIMSLSRAFEYEFISCYVYLYFVTWSGSYSQKKKSYLKLLLIISLSLNWDFWCWRGMKWVCRFCPHNS